MSLLDNTEPQDAPPVLPGWAAAEKGGCVTGPPTDRETWLLYVDETGFRAGAHAWSTVGVLLRTDEPWAIDEIVREALRESVPFLPYPLHATDLRNPLSLVGGWLRRATAATDACWTTAEQELAPHCARAWDALRAAEDPAARPFVEALESGERPAWKERQKALAWLDATGDPSVGFLRRAARNARQDLRSLLATLGHYAGEGGCVVVAGAGPRPAEVADADDGDLFRLFAAYPTFLAALLERVFTVLGGEGAARRELWLRVASAPWLDGRGGTRALHKRDVEALAGDVVVRLAVADVQAPAVRVLAPQAYNRAGESLASGLVLADFLANALSRPLGRDVPWTTFQTDTRKETGLACCRPASWSRRGVALPTIAWLGPPGAAIAAAWGGAAIEVDLRHVTPRWAGEQALPWVIAIRTIRPPAAQGGAP